MQRSELLPPNFQPLPTGSVRPSGWLLDQMRIQANGLTGHLDEFWPDVRDSGWIGGSAEGWERGPYWLDGLVPLAFLLDDGRLSRKAELWIDYIVKHQATDGWLGPVVSVGKDPASPEGRDPWPIFIVLKAMAQYQEATEDDRIVPSMLRAVHRIMELLSQEPLSSWAYFRWPDFVLSMHWLHERTGESWLLGAAQRVFDQGYDWFEHFANFRYKRKATREERSLATHVVNNAMSLRASGLWWRQSGNPRHRGAIRTMLETLDAYHGQATGLFTGDEHFAGRNPSQGTELCAVVEYMYSLEVLGSVLGDVALSDRLERIAFNALPGAISPDMWAHQYDQQANQLVCAVTDHPIWTTNGPDSNVFGLQPFFGCCTANLHQGWPKFAAHQWMRSADGLAAMTWAPAAVRTTVGSADVAIRVDTGYPFSGDIDISISTDRPARFPLDLRIPTWATGATVSMGSTTEPAQPGTFHRIEREWNSGSTIHINLPMDTMLEQRFNNSVSISRGPVVFSLAVGEKWEKTGGEEPHATYEVHPTTPWNYALDLDPSRPEESIRFTQRRDLRGEPASKTGMLPVFSREGAPTSATVAARRVAEWQMNNNAADPPPQSPVSAAGVPEEVTLLPYGCARLRVTEMPVLERGSREAGGVQSDT